MKSIHKTMNNPPHPGELLKELCLNELGITITAAAKGLGVSRKHLSDVINGHFGISPEMAMRLQLAFGSSAEFWLKAQLSYDLWQIGQRAGDLKVKKLAA